MKTLYYRDMSEWRNERLPNLREGKKVSRRTLLKGALGFAGLVLTNSALYRLLEGEPASGIKGEAGPFGQFVDPGYPTVSWVRANMAVGVYRLDGYEIPPGGRFSLLDGLFPDQNSIFVDNTDPKKGFVFGLARDKNFITRVTANGVCKISTDLFRCALASPVIIEESHSHARISSGSPYFRYYPFGTDAAVLFKDDDIKSSDRWDLVFKNPWDVPLRLRYMLADTKGRIIGPDSLMGKLQITDYAVGQWMKMMEVLDEKSIPRPRGVIPDLLEIMPITSIVAFEPVTEDGDLSKFRNWRVGIDGPKRLTNNDLFLGRRLYIADRLVDDYTRIAK